LRRHELADLAGISLTWYTWLEQGRDIHISPTSIDSIAKALLLEEPGRRHLRVLAGWPDVTPPIPPVAVDEHLLAFINDLLPSPVAITSPTWDFLAWNAAWARVFGDPDRISPERRNGLWITFMCPEYRARIVDWESEAINAVARHREIAGPYASDPALRKLWTDLAAASHDFRRLWDLNLVQNFSGRMQLVKHPCVGLLDFKVMQLRPVDSPAIKLVIRRANDKTTLEKLHKLLRE